MAQTHKISDTPKRIDPSKFVNARELGSIGCLTNAGAAWPPAGEATKLNLRAAAKISRTNDRPTIPWSCRRSARCRPPRPDGYGVRRRHDDSAAHTGYR